MPPERHDPTGTGSDRSPTIDTTTIEADGAALDCSLVPWDSASFGFPVAQVTRVELGPDGQSGAMLQTFDAWCAAREVRLVSCRLDHTRLRESMALEGHGFRFVEWVYEPRLDAFDGIPAPRHAIEIARAEPGDLASIEEIAYEAFSTGRFLLDSRLAPELSRRRYASWVRTSFTAPGQMVLKAEVDGELLGFFIVEHRPDGGVYWHLTAVAPRWQGKGMGLSLWRTMLLRHQAEGATSVATTISGHNLPAINLYARLGFAFSAAKMTFHWLPGSRA
jgi:RimJ/RimL family protein N-acetyltransferase